MNTDVISVWTGNETKRFRHHADNIEQRTVLAVVRVVQQHAAGHAKQQAKHFEQRVLALRQHVHQAQPMRKLDLLVHGLSRARSTW